jgi:hypothetical protein
VYYKKRPKIHFAKQIPSEKTRTKLHLNKHNKKTRRRTITSNTLNQQELKIQLSIKYTIFHRFLSRCYLKMNYKVRNTLLVTIQQRLLCRLKKPWYMQVKLRKCRGGEYTVTYSKSIRYLQRDAKYEVRFISLLQYDVADIKRGECACVTTARSETFTLIVCFFSRPI